MHMRLTVFALSFLILLPASALADPSKSQATIMKIIIPQGASIQGRVAYFPENAHVPAGSLVIWENFDSVPHTAVSGRGPTQTTGLFDSGIINSREKFPMSVSSLTPGVYDYFCVIHPYMMGKLTIESAKGRQTFPLIIDDKTYEIEYSITGGKLIGLVADKNHTSLTAALLSTDDGNLTLTIHRSVFQSTEAGGKDTPFAVFSDVPIEPKEIESTDEFRTISIDFENGTKTIDIVGTWMVPEFANTTWAIMAIGVIGIIAIIRATKRGKSV